MKTNSEACSPCDLHETYISDLKKRLLEGETVTPLTAFREIGMAMNTFNRQIWELKHIHGMQIESIQMVENGKRYKAHRCII